MKAQELSDVARSLVAAGKGLLAIDESNGTCNKRFAAASIPQTYEARCAYRELLVQFFTTKRSGKKVTTVRPLSRPFTVPASFRVSKSIPVRRLWRTIPMRK